MQTTTITSFTDNPQRLSNYFKQELNLFVGRLSYLCQLMGCYQSSVRTEDAWFLRANNPIL
ncbi:MAG: hypothetical protein ACKVH8_13145 [Pirellulales bacterium]